MPTFPATTTHLPMSIQWFPGHMTSARKKAAETLAAEGIECSVIE